MLGTAISIASMAFATKKDKGGRPYIMHCLRVMFSVEHLGEDAMCAAVLHDLIEDTAWTAEMLYEAGFSSYVVRLIEKLTHDPDVSYDDYIKTIAPNKTARKIKMADIKDNSDITRLKGLTKNDFDRMEKYHRSYTYLKKV